MRRIPAAATWAIGLIATASIPSAGQDEPAVIIRPPADVRPSPPLPDASVPVASPAPAPAADPGVAVPVLRPRPTSGDRPDLGPPSDLTAGMPRVAVRPPQDGARPRPVAGDGSRPLVISPTIAPAVRPGEDNVPGPNPLLPTGPDRPGSSRPRSPIVEGEATERRPPIVPDRGRTGLLGGLFGRRSGRPTGDGAASTIAAPATAIDPDDPETVEALRRGLERQIVGREGPRLASLEVLVVGRRVHIRAQAARVWQRRALRRALEGMGMPAGFLSTVEVR